MSVYECDPIQDPRWPEFRTVHRRASVFHSIGWLRALRETYGYEPIVFTTSPTNEVLSNGIVLCRVKSWLTGRRLVSLPFSDYCEPLFDSLDEFDTVLDHLLVYLKNERYRYLSMRPWSAFSAAILQRKSGGITDEYFLHSVNLKPDLNVVYESFDKDSIQRRIRRAERSGLVEKCGRSDELLREFYGLFLTTRRRQRVPPTPFVWFQNLAREVGQGFRDPCRIQGPDPNRGHHLPQFKDMAYYKYGCSDYRFNQFGATPWLFWKAICSAKSKGALRFDLGRTEQENKGLLTFKNHWDPAPQKLAYWRVPGNSGKKSWGTGEGNTTRKIFALVPGRIQRRIGEFLYPHLG